MQCTSIGGTGRPGEMDNMLWKEREKRSDSRGTKTDIGAQYKKHVVSQEKNVRRQGCDQTLARSCFTIEASQECISLQFPNGIVDSIYFIIVSIYQSSIFPLRAGW